MTHPNRPAPEYKQPYEIKMQVQCDMHEPLFPSRYDALRANLDEYTAKIRREAGNSVFMVAGDSITADNPYPLTPSPALTPETYEKVRANLERVPCWGAQPPSSAEHQRWLRVDDLKKRLRRAIGDAAADEKILACWMTAVADTVPNSETMERLLTEEIALRTAEKAAQEHLDKAAKPPIAVAVGQVYEMPGFELPRRMAVVSQGVAGEPFWNLDSYPNCHLAHHVKHNGWRLVGCVLSDGRQMCEGETWVYSNPAGTVHEHTLLSAHAYTYGPHVGEVYFRNGRSIIDSDDVKKRPERWRKVERLTRRGIEAIVAHACGIYADEVTVTEDRTGLIQCLVPRTVPYTRLKEAEHRVMEDHLPMNVALFLEWHPEPAPPEPTHRCPKCRAATTFSGVPLSSKTGPGVRSKCRVCDGVSFDEELIPLAAPAAPLSARDQKRKKIDAVLAKDRRLYPAFADARRAAVLAACETDLAATPKTVLHHLHIHEAEHGSSVSRHQHQLALDAVRDQGRLAPPMWKALVAYERARPLCGVSR